MGFWIPCEVEPTGFPNGAHVVCENEELRMMSFLALAAGKMELLSVKMKGLCEEKVWGEEQAVSFRHVEC